MYKQDLYLYVDENLYIPFLSVSYLCIAGPAHSVKLAVLSLRELPTSTFQQLKVAMVTNTGIHHQGLVAFQMCKNLVKRRFREWTGNNVWFIADYRTVMLHCILFSWYNRLSGWLISPCESVRVFVVSEYESLTLYGSTFICFMSIRTIEPAWLAHLPLVLDWFWKKCIMASY